MALVLIRTFDTRITIGKHKQRDGTKVPANLYYPFGMYFSDPGHRQTHKLYSDRELVIDLSIDGLSKGSSILTINGGCPLYKFPTPPFESTEYDVYAFVYAGIEFEFEIRLASQAG
jgi:hypothetical protein